MPPPANVKCVVVVLACRRCHAEQTIYLLMEQPVPQRVRCPDERLGGGSGRTSLSCAKCDWRFPNISDLRRAVADELRRRDASRHLRRGAVRIEC